MIEIMSALGVRRLRFMLPTNVVPPQGTRERERFRLSGLIPFGARWVFERIVCDTEGSSATYVRVLIK